MCGSRRLWGHSMHHSLQRRSGIWVSEGRAIDGGGLDVNGGGVMLGKRVRKVIGRARGKLMVTMGVSEGIEEVWYAYCHDLSRLRGRGMENEDGG